MDRSNMPTPQQPLVVIVPTSSLTPHDILLGRGMHRQRYPGNVALREYVATRKSEYASGSKAAKHAVAAEVVAWVRDGDAAEGRNRGRFLRLITDEEKLGLDPELWRRLAAGGAAGQEGEEEEEEEEEELWTLAEEAAVMEKAKQLLRQMPSVKKRTEMMPQRVSAAAESASASAALAAASAAVSSASASASCPMNTASAATSSAAGGAGSAAGASGVGLVTSVPSVPTMPLSSSQGAKTKTDRTRTNAADGANGVEEEEDFDLDFDLEAMADAVGVGGRGGVGVGIGGGKGSGGGGGAMPAAGTAAKLQALYDASPEALEPLPISSSAAGTSATNGAAAGASGIAADPSSLSAEVDDLTRSILAQLREQEEIDAAVSTDIVAEMRREAAGVVLGGGAGAGVGAGGVGGIGDEKKEETLLKDIHSHGAFNSDGGGACSTAQTVADLAAASSPPPPSSHNTGTRGRTEKEEQKRAALLQTMRGVLEASKSLDDRLGGEAARSRTDIDVEELTKKELRTVGEFLFQHFTGVICSGPSHHDEVSKDDNDSTADEQGRSKRRGPGRTLSQHEESSQQLRDAGLPTPVCILIQGLLDVTSDVDVSDDDRFTSTKDLLEEVDRMVCNPDRYLFDPPPEHMTGTIQLPRGKLYGREEQIAQLTSLIDALPQPEQRTHVVWLSGHSGTGKSSLVEASLLSSRQIQNGRVILCKFDPQAGPGQCLPAIFGAFNDYCRELVLGGGDLLDHIRRKILLALGANVVVLMDLIPDLRTLVGDSVVQAASAAFQGATREALERFVHCFRVFVRTISSPSHPIIMFVDDVQWADASGLELLSSLIHDFDMRSMLFVGAYRDDAIGDEHPLRATIDGITSAGISSTPIHLGDLETGSINSFVADTLHLSPRLTRDLSSIIQSKTSGNPLFAAECLVDLSDQGLLQFSPTARRWTWDILDIQAHEIAENALSLVAGKISRLPENLQWILRVASCLGSRFRKSTINIVLPFASEGSSSTEDSLQRLQEEGLIADMGQHLSFAHDSIQESAYALIDPSERNAFHLAVGRMLWQAMVNSNEGKNSEILYDAVAQLNRGIDLVPDKDEKLVIAELNLLAGEKVVALGSFLQASLYLEQGASLVEEDDWQTNYELCVKLFTIGSECMYVVGNNEVAICMAQQALLHCRNFDDKLPAYAALIQSLGAATKLQQAIDCGLEVLQQVEDDFPTTIARQDTMQAFGKTKSMLEQRDASSISGGPANETKSKATAMSILMMLTRYAFVVNPGLMGMIICRMVQISLQFGVCAESSFAFAAFASTCCKFGMFELARTCGSISKQLLGKFENQYLANVYCLLYISIFAYTQPWQAILDEFDVAYEAGMAAGDIEWSMTSRAHVAALSLFIPRGNATLDNIIQSMKHNVQELRSYKHRTVNVCLPILQAALNLAGSASESAEDDPTLLVGEAMDQNQLFVVCRERHLFMPLRMALICRIWLSCIFERYDEVGDIIDEWKAIEDKMAMFPAAENITEVFYVGLVSITLTQNGRDEYRDLAVECAGKMKGFAAAGCPWNFDHRVQLLSAEMQNLEGDDVAGAAETYGQAIKSASEHGFRIDQAVACERAAASFCRQGSIGFAKPFLQQAQSIYNDLGAKRKVKHIGGKLAKLSTEGILCAS